MVDNLELAVYRNLASFSYKSSNSPDSSFIKALNLFVAIEKLVSFCKSNKLHLSNELLNFIALTINGTLSNDQQLIRPQITDGTLRIIYERIKWLHDNDIDLWNGINNIPSNQNNSQLFFFPGQPTKAGWKFIFSKFAFVKTSDPKHRFPLNIVQHVVHNIDDVVSMLQTIPNKVHFKGYLHGDYRGVPLCWFSPLPPAQRYQSRFICDSLNPRCSRYGCFRFILPFKSLNQRFPKCFILGTRKYNQEHSHTILLTKQGVQYIMLTDQQLPRKLTDTTFIRHGQESFEWLCFNDDTWKKWDQLEFAIATQELIFDPQQDSIRLDFVDHTSNVCVPSCRTHTTCGCKWDRKTAMKYFLIKLNERRIKLHTFRQFFSEHVWNELIDIKKTL